MDVKQPIGAMGSIEFISTCFAIAGIVSILTGVYNVNYQQKSMFAVVNENEMNCPDIRVRHFVGSDLKTGVQAVNACSQHLNIKIK